MINYKDLILNIVNFENGYSQSKNWIGFFEINGLNNLNNIKKAVDVFLDYFDMDNFVILTSYYIDIDNVDWDLHIENEVKEIEQELVDRQYIPLLSCNNMQDDDFFRLDTNFKIIKTNKLDLYKKFSIMGICDTNIGFSNGHCFFISIKNDIIAYPHGDDGGYGFFYINKKRNNIGYDFLHHIANNKDFNVKINE